MGARIQTEPVRPESLIAALASASDGAVNLFLGIVRDHNAGRRVLYLEYEAYGAMAEQEMARLEQRALERFAISAVAIAHRVGRLQIGEVAVAIAVAAERRRAAIEATASLIEELKKSVPIWKKEFFEGGERWIEGPG